MVRGSHQAWRRILAGILVYALVLQAFIFAADTLQAATGGAQGISWAGFELCTHDGGGSGTPAQAPVGDSHCPFCLAGALYVSGMPCAAQYRKILLTNVAWPLAAPQLASFFVNESAWPRGPPSAV